MERYEERLESIKHYINAYNKFDIQGMLRDLHPSIHFENIADGQVNVATDGIEAFKDQAERAKGLFREREQKIIHVQPAADTIVVQIEYRAILAKDLPDGLKAGDKIEMRGQSSFSFKDGKIARIADES